LDIVEGHVAGDPDRNRVNERRALADRQLGDPSQSAVKEPVHRPASPRVDPRCCLSAIGYLAELCGSNKLIIRRNKAALSRTQLQRGGIAPSTCSIAAG